MDWNRVEGNWKQLRGQVKERWGRLTDDDLTAIAGKRDELEGKIQERYGYTKDRIRKEIDDWRRSVESNVRASSRDTRRPQVAECRLQYSEPHSLPRAIM